jgi:hypothetical protein
MSARTIRITAGEVTATAIWKALPIEAKASAWGGNPAIFKKVRAGAQVRLQRADQRKG